MKNIFLITDKLNKTKQLEVYDTEKDVFKHFSPRTNLIELIEKVDDTLLDKRLEFWTAQHGLEVKPVDLIPESTEPKKRFRPSGLKYKLTKKDRKARSKRMKENNPNKDGLRPQQIEAIRKAFIGNQWAKGRVTSEETKSWLSYLGSSRKVTKGHRWVYNPTLNKELLIHGESPLPEGYHYGRNREVMELIGYYRDVRRHKKGGEW